MTKKISFINETNIINITKKGMGIEKNLFIPSSRRIHMFYHRLNNMDNKAVSNNDFINVKSCLLNGGQKIVIGE